MELVEVVPESTALNTPVVVEPSVRPAKKAFVTLVAS
jgi:hypothetical protein